MAIAIRSVIMRGGTSRAVFLKIADLPADPRVRDRVILKMFGSPDKRQIDGLAGADPLTSKLAIIGPPPATADAAGCHLQYTFGQVEIDRPEIDFKSLCGNISSAVGAFGVYENMVPVAEPITTVRVWNTNLNRELRVETPVEHGRPVESGDYVVPGVPGSGARILVDFAATAGAATGALLPTGSPIDVLDLPGGRRIEASLVDIGNAHVFVRARDVGLTGIETPEQIDRDHALLDLMERIRAAGAVRMGLLEDPARSREETPATPIVGVVAPPADYREFLTGRMVEARDIDVVGRLLFMQRAHKTYAGTSTVCTGVASRLHGTVVHEAARAEHRDAVVCRIGHPGGVIETECRTSPDGRVGRATLGRTARRIMEGYAFVPDEVLRA